MANLGDTYLKSLQDEPMYCVLTNNCWVNYFTSLESAESHHRKLNLTTKIWVDGEENPNTEFIENYEKNFVKINAPFPCFMAEEQMHKGRSYSTTKFSYGRDIY